MNTFSLTENRSKSCCGFESTLKRLSVTPRAASGLNRRLSLAVLLAMTAFFSSAVFAEHLSWHQQSRSYDVHLGVVPASVLDQDADLARMHRMAMGGEHLRTLGTRHIMVAVFRRPGNERVVDAEVVVEVIENDLVRVKKAEKHLKLMPVNGMPTFCSFFDLHWNGKFRVNVTIDEPAKGSEMVSFLQEASGLPE